MEQQLKEEEEKNKADSAAKQFVKDTTRAEVMLVELIAQLNLSINSADAFTEAFKTMFPDSKIAQAFSCARTKTTAIIKDIAKVHKDSLLERMKTSPFSLSTDGSNDSNSKLYPIVVRTVNPQTLSVEAEVVSLPVLDESATGKNIFGLLDALLTEADIDWKNCVAFGCDNASVMTGIHKGVFAFIKEKNPTCVLSGCTLHLVHLAAEKASHLLPFQPADLLIDIFYSMKKSSVHQRNLGIWQEYHGNQQRSMLKHVSTRWLSIGRCVSRLIEDWRPLRSFFEDEVSKHTKSGSSAHTKACSILNSLNSETAKLCCLFTKYVVSTFEPFLTHHQAETPLIHVLHENIQKLMREVLTKFVKPSAFKSRLPFEVEYKQEYNIKDNADISIGLTSEQYINDKKYSVSKKKKILLARQDVLHCRL